jgi:hypothetical protein
VILARRFDVGCTVRVCHTNEELSAHVELDDGVDLGPGDRLRLHGEHVPIVYGQERTERRRATVTRATPFGRWWVRLTGDLAALELLDVSFTDRRTL